jgi:multiple sugar transport system permease protein
MTRKEKRFAILLLLPAVVAILFLGVFPVLSVFSFSLHDWDVMEKSGEFVLFENFGYLFTHSDFWVALKNSLVWTFFSVFFQFFVGLGLALFLNKKFFARDVYRGLMFFSYLIPTIVIAIVWRFMLNDVTGILALGLGKLGIDIAWFGSPDTAMMSVIIVNVWKYFPFVVVVLLAQLQTIDRQMYEASEIDGAKAFQQFRHITWPFVRPVAFIVILLRTIWTIKNFDVIKLLTGGGPLDATETLPILTYDTVFKAFHLGRGSSVAVIMFLILVLSSTVYIRLYKKYSLENIT